MTGSAQVVQLRGGEAGGVARMHSLRVPYMIGGRTVACLATHSLLQGDDRLIRRRYADRPRRVAGETSQHRRRWVEDPIAHTRHIAMPRRQCHAVQFAVPALAMLQVIVRIHATDKSDRLETRSKRPFTGLRRLGSGERVGVRAGGLSGEFGWVAGLAGRRARIVGRGGTCQMKEKIQRRE